jgi:hypothetical protein
MRGTAAAYAAAVLYLLALVAFGWALAAVVLLGEWDGRWLLAGLASAGLLAVAWGLVLIAKDLPRRRIGAWKAAVVVDSVVIVAGLIGTLAMLDGFAAAHDAGLYLFVGLVTIVGLTAFSLVALTAPSTREWLRAPAAGWYRDPDANDAWRWWDGTDWTGHVV